MLRKIRRKEREKCQFVTSTRSRGQPVLQRSCHRPVHGRVLPGKGLVDQRDPILLADEDGDPQWKGGLRHANDGIDEGDEAYRGGVRKAVRNVRTRMTTGTLPWNEQLSIIDKAAVREIVWNDRPRRIGR